MNIHEAAIEVLHDGPTLPFGLCSLFTKYGATSGYEEMILFMGDRERLSKYGEWTDQRLNIVILLAITTPEDFI